MVLGLRTKTRKGTSVHVEFVIHVEEIKPWPPSQSLKSLRSVLLQWENGERHSGFTKTVVPSIGSGSDGKIEFNESFRIPVTLSRELSVKGVELETFQKNYLELNLYEPRRDKIVKGQLLGTVMVDLAEYGLLKDLINITAPMNCKRSYRNTSQPVLYMKIQPYERDRGSSSSRHSVSKGILLDKEGKESVSALMSEEYAEEAEIASFTDDDVSSQCSQTSMPKSPPYSEETADSLFLKSDDSWGVRKLDEENATRSFKEDSARANRKSDLLVEKVLVQSGMDPSMMVNELTSSDEAIILDNKKSTKMSVTQVPSSSESPEINGPSKSDNLKQNVTTISDILLALRTGSSLLSDPENATVKAGLNNSTNGISAIVTLEGAAGYSSEITSGTPVVPKGFDKEGEEGNVGSEMAQNQITAKCVSTKVLVQVAPGDNSKFALGTIVQKGYDYSKGGEGPKNADSEIANYQIIANGVNKVMVQKPLGDNTEIELGAKVQEGCDYKEGGEGPVGTGSDLADNQINSNGVRTERMVQDPAGENSNIASGTMAIQKSYDYEEGGGPLSTGSEMADSRITANGLLMEVMVQEAPGNNNDIISGTTVGQKTYDCKGGGGHPTAGSEMADGSTTVNIGYSEVEGEAEEDKKRNAVEEGESNKEIQPGVLELAEIKNRDGEKADELDKHALQNRDTIYMNENSDSEEVIQDFSGSWKRPEMNGELSDCSCTNSSATYMEGETSIVQPLKVSQCTHGNQVTSCTNMEAFSDDNLRATVNSTIDDGLKHGNKSVRTVLGNSMCMTLGNNNLFVHEGKEFNSLNNFNSSTIRFEELHSRLDAADEVNVSRMACEDVCNSKIQELEHGIEKLETELRETAALEVALYSIVAEHGSSVHKVHTPARRLSRLYIYAYRNWSAEKRASSARSMISGLVLVAKACGNDVARLMYWLSNSVVLRTIISQGFSDSGMQSQSGTHTDTNKFGRKNRKSNSTLKWKESFIEKNKEATHFKPSSVEWWDPNTFTAAIEKIESWIFSQIIKSIWWQTLTLYMQYPTNGENSQLRSVGKMSSLAPDLRGNFSINLWKKAFQDAFERLCPVRAAGHECGCLPVLAKLVMEQCVARLDVAMFNAILRESYDEIPTDPVSDPISGSKVLPISGSLSFGAGAQLKNAIGTWSRWLTDLFGIDADDSLEDMNCHDDERQNPATSFKSFHLLNALSNLLMLPKDMLLDSSITKEVCPTFAAPLIKRILWKFVPDEFCPDRVPEAVLDALDSESPLDEQLSPTRTEPITSYPCGAAPIKYSPPPAPSVSSIIGDVQGHIKLKKNSSLVLRKCHISDDELDELDYPLSSIIDKVPSSPSKVVATGPILPEHISSSGKGNAIRYQLLREVWLEGD